MCLLAFSWNAHPRYRFVFAGNRDERHARPSAPASWWPDAGDVLGGRDLEAGGSWLGLRRDGRFAVVTNFREPDVRPIDKRSRGELVGDFLKTRLSPAQYLQATEAHADEYAGFNLLFGDMAIGDGELLYLTNRDGHNTMERVVKPGIHALSNHLLDTPWPKVQRLHERFVNELQRDEPRVEKLMEFLEDSEPALDGELPVTGLSPEWERRLSSAKIINEEYGTRASTVIRVANDGRWEFVERRFNPDGSVAGETREHFGAR